MLTDDLAVKAPDKTEERLIPPAPVLVTVHEVALGTPAAMDAELTTRRWWREAIHKVSAVVHRAVAPSTQSGHPYMRRSAVLESNCMARAMDRL